MDEPVVRERAQALCDVLVARDVGRATGISVPSAAKPSARCSRSCRSR